MLLVWNWRDYWKFLERSFLSLGRKTHRRYNSRFIPPRASSPRLFDFFCSSPITMNGGPSGFSYAPSLNNPSPPLIRSNYCNFPSWVFDLTIESFELFADNAPVTRAFVITSVLFTVFLGIRGGGGGSSSKLALSYQVVNLLFQMSSLYSLFDFKLL